MIARRTIAWMLRRWETQLARRLFCGFGLSECGMAAVQINDNLIALAYPRLSAAERALRTLCVCNRRRRENNREGRNRADTQRCSPPLSGLNPSLRGHDSPYLSAVAVMSPQRHD